jgi:hypothetical protein
MATAFDEKRQALQTYFAYPLNLSLKIITHYGPISEFTIGNFKKLYGEVVVEAHRLLKNSIRSDSYLLLTDRLIADANNENHEQLINGIKSHKLCEIYGDLRNICFTYFEPSETNTSKMVA